MEWTVETVFPRGQRVGIGQVRGLWLDGHLVEGIRLAEMTIQSNQAFERPRINNASLDFEIPSDRMTEFLVSEPETRTMYRALSDEGATIEESTTFVSAIRLKLKLRDRLFHCLTLYTANHQTIKVRVEMGCANLQVIDSPIDSMGWVRRKDELIKRLAQVNIQRNCELISDGQFFVFTGRIQEEINYIQREIELIGQRDPNTQSRVFRWEDVPVEQVDARFLRYESRQYPVDTRMVWTHPAELKPQAIGDTTCLNNANSRHLRCAVSPMGPCEGCDFYEKN